MSDNNVWGILLFPHFWILVTALMYYTVVPALKSCYKCIKNKLNTR